MYQAQVQLLSCFITHSLTLPYVNFKTHSRERTFECSHCDYASVTEGNLRTHFKTQDPKNKIIYICTTPLGRLRRIKLGGLGLVLCGTL